MQSVRKMVKGEDDKDEVGATGVKQETKRNNRKKILAFTYKL